MESINPATGEVIRQYEEMTPEQVNEVLEKVDLAFQSWRTTSFSATAERPL